MVAIIIGAYVFPISFLFCLSFLKKKLTLDDFTKEFPTFLQRLGITLLVFLVGTPVAIWMYCTDKDAKETINDMLFGRTKDKDYVSEIEADNESLRNDLTMEKKNQQHYLAQIAALESENESLRLEDPFAKARNEIF